MNITGIFRTAPRRLLAGELNLTDLLLDIKVSLLAGNLQAGLNKNTSVSDSSRYAGYLAVCRLAAERDDVFKIFKGLSDYRRILEHATREQGQAYLDIIKAEGSELLPYFSKFAENDTLGRPKRYRYELGTFSPTTLRYIKVLTDLNNLFGGLSGFSIMEIGVGYGGQCKIINDAFSPASYSLVDLEVVLPLVRKYLASTSVMRAECVPAEQLSGDATYDLVISNYAFSECAKSVQEMYLDKVLRRSKRGYLTCNYISSIVYKREELCGMLSAVHPSLRVIEERPLTTPPTMEPNYILVWDDTKAG